MTPATLPPSIRLVESEVPYVHDGLDFDYIDAVAAAVAAALLDGRSVESAYQPGDGTFYGLVFTPLDKLVAAPPRVKGGVEWETHAVRGIRYRPGAVLVSLAERMSYPFMLHQDGGSLAAIYVSEKLTIGSATSGVSIAILLRAVGSYLDAYIAGNVPADGPFPRD